RPGASAGPLACRTCSAILALPDLRLADEGHAALHLELATALDLLHLRLVHLAIVGLEDGAAAVGVAVALHAADDFHAGDRLALAIVLALVAGRIGFAGIEQLDDAAAERAVGALRDLHDRLGLAGFIVDGLPAANGGVSGEGRQAKGQQTCCNEKPGSQVVHGSLPGDCVVARRPAGSAPGAVRTVEYPTSPEAWLSASRAP